MIRIIIKKVMKIWVSKYRNVQHVINKYEPTFEMFLIHKDNVHFRKKSFTVPTP